MIHDRYVQVQGNLALKDIWPAFMKIVKSHSTLQKE